MPQIVSNADADQMFTHSVCQVENDLVFVIGCNGNNTMNVHSILSNKQYAVAQDADLIVAPLDFQLGYYQDGSAAVYLERKPQRQYRVGWYSRNTASFPSPDRILGRASTRLSLKRMVEKEYPTFQRACEDSVKNEARIAFERQWAVDYRGRIHYKGNIVGSWSKEAGTQLSPEFGYLQSQLENLV